MSMKLKILTKKENNKYNGIRINNHTINSGDALIDWIDKQLYCNQHKLTDIIEDESVTMFLVTDKEWTSYEIDGLEFVVPYSIDKHVWIISEIQTYYKIKKQEQENNPFKNFI